MIVSIKTMPHMALSTQGYCCDEPDVYDDYCDNCDQDVTDGGVHLWGYSYKPFGTMYLDFIDGNFHWLPTAELPTSKLIYGLELEVEYRDAHDIDLVVDALTGINSAFGMRDENSPAFCIAKEDSTVDVEFVTAPFTFDAFVAAQQQLDVTLQFMQDYFKGYWSNSAGAHVHVNKSSLSLTTAYAWIQFHYQNPGLIADIAQRSVGPDAEWCYMQKPNMSVAKIAKYKGGFPNRGALADSYNTIEHRYFRSNLRVDRLSKNIEFLESMFQYFNMLTYQDMARDGAHKLYAYLAHVSLMRHQYPNLYNFLVEKGYIACV